jgi:branched-chain amino acid transport system substrate-binding protein
MEFTRRGVLGTAVATATSLALPLPARAQKQGLRIGLLSDMSGPYRDDTGMTGVICARQAIEDFGAANRGIDVEVIFADHQNKPDVGAGVARRWLDQDGVDVVLDVPTSSVALAVNTVVRERNKVYLNSGGGTSDLTGPQCSPNLVHWTYDTASQTKSTIGSLMREGQNTYFMVVADYVFGQSLERDATKVIEAGGGRVVGRVAYPFPETNEFSSLLLRAQASGAKVLALCNAGGDTVNCIKQAREFGLLDTMKVAALQFQSTAVHGTGLEVAQGILTSAGYYWDFNSRTRAFNDRIKPKSPKIWPNMTQAGCYGATLHYLKTVADMGVAAAKADGRAVVERMKRIPTDDDVFGAGRIREDGRHLHDVHLFEVKKPFESENEWDVMKFIATTPAEQAFRPLAEGGCPLVKI